MKRTPLKAKLKKQKPISDYKCVVCKKPAAFLVGLKKVCSHECAQQLALKSLAKVKDEKEKSYRRETKRIKQEINEKDVNWWIKQIHGKGSFNAYIKLRDYHKPCISCGKYEHDLNMLDGGYWDAGHYRTVAAASHLRFDPDNCHKQCRTCNRGGEAWTALGETVKDGYDRRIIQKIGIERVEALKNNNTIHHWTVDELREIHEKYKKLYKEEKKRLEL